MYFKSILMALLTALSMLASAADLLPNGNFEQLSGKQPKNWSYPWQKPLHRLDSEIKVSGKYALCMPPLAEGYYAMTGYTGKIADFPETLTISGMIKYDNLAIGQQPDGKRLHPPFIGIWTNLENGANSISIPAVKFEPGTRDWFSFETTVTRAELEKQIAAQPVDKRPVRWTLRLNFMPQPGTIWIDNLKLIDPSIAGKPAIVYGGNLPGKGEAQAVADLALYLGKVTGQSWTVIAPADWSDGQKAIFVGPEAARVAGMEPGSYESEEWHLKNTGNNFVITGGRPRGIAYGVYEFLGKYAGCAWLDFDTEVVPSKPDFQFPRTDERNKPAFNRREVYTESPQSGLFRFRNKESLRTGFPEFDSMLGRPNGCHTFSWYSKEWKDPDLFATTANGQRGMTQMCMTNPKVRELVLKQLREYIAEDRAKYPRDAWPVIYDISQNDGGSGGECFCAGCKKVFEEENNRYSGVNNRFINAVARKIRKEYPELLIRTFAYSYTQEPPGNVVADDNVLIHSCNSWLFEPLLGGTRTGKILEGWKPFSKNIAIWAYWKPYVGFEYPYVKARDTIQKELQFCRDNGVIHLFIETENAQKRSFFQLQHFLALKLMQDPDQPLEPLVNLFMENYYGKAAPVMQEYLAYLESRQQEVPPGAAGGELWSYLDEKFYTTANRLLVRAETLAAEDPAALRHVHLERVPVDGSMLILWADLAKKFTMPERKSLIERYEQCARKAIVNTNGAKWRQSQIDKQLRELENEIKLFKALPAPLPEQFKGKDIVDLHWKDFNPYTDHIERCLVEEPDAVCGVAFRVPNQTIDKKKYGRPALHFAPLEYGVWESHKRSSFTLKLPQNKMPQDEKYHWYRVGVVEIHPRTIVFVHWSWMLQIYLRKAAVDIIPPKMEVWISMKLAGPAYVANSTSENNVFVDRVILVRQ